MDDSFTRAPEADDHLSKFERALRTLRRFTDLPMRDDRDRAGVVQAFEFTFELAWKSVQDWTTLAGFSERGPRPVLRAAFQAELISEEDERLLQAMANDRSLASHTDREDQIERIAAAVVADYVSGLEKLAAKLRASESD